MGGSPAHTLALDHSLRPVLDSLGAQQLGPSVFALEAQVTLAGAGGAPAFDADLQRRLDAGARRLSLALDWHAAQRDEALAPSLAAAEAAQRLRSPPVRCSA